MSPIKSYAVYVLIGRSKVIEVMHASVRLIEVSGIPYKPSCDISTINACLFQLRRVYGTVPAIMSYIIII